MYRISLCLRCLLLISNFVLKANTQYYGAPSRCPYSDLPLTDLLVDANTLSARKINNPSYELKLPAAPLTSDHSIDAFINDVLRTYDSKISHLTTTHTGESVDDSCLAPPVNCFNNTGTLYYRSIDGSCNNLLYPGFGMAKSRYSRLVTPKYQKLPSVSMSGTLLPSARILSLSLYGEETFPDQFRTLAAMQWGQFVAHDISRLSTKGAPENCCTDYRHKLCYPIPLPPDGPIAYNTGKSCMSFAKSLSESDMKCPIRSTQNGDKVTLVTAYLDLSSLYGNSLKESHNVRLYTSGLLRTNYINSQHWMPITQNLNGECGSHSECYDVPDSRNRFTPTIAALHTILLREHNRIAGQLAYLNPHYSDEQLYQEARKINIAQFQKITFYDWLPLYVGESFAYSNGLIYYTSQPSEYVNDYDESIDASPYAEYASAAFRYAHTQIPGWFSLVAPNRDANQTFRLSDFFETPQNNRFLFTSDNFDALLRGLATQVQKQADTNIDSEIKHYFDRKLFEEYGSDLKAIDIQRSRDFLLPSYNDLRQVCGLSRATEWSGFSKEIPQNKIALLQKLYAIPDDVELSIGGSLERHVQGSLFGPTFLCIIGKQFLKTRAGDRFFFERENPQGGLTKEQLIEIRKASVAGLFCNNANYLRSIQSNVFVFPNTRNTLQNCVNIPQVDLNKWKTPNVFYN